MYIRSRSAVYSNKYRRTRKRVAAFNHVCKVYICTPSRCAHNTRYHTNWWATHQSNVTSQTHNKLHASLWPSPWHDFASGHRTKYPSSESGGGKLGEDTCSSFWCFFARIYADATIRSHNDVCSPTQMTVLCGRCERDPKPKTNYMHTHQRTWNFLIIFIVLPQTYHESVPHTTATIFVCMCMRG